MKNIVKALIQANKEFLPVKKNCFNKFLNSWYADLDSYKAATINGLCNNGLIISQVFYNGRLVTRLLHESGEEIVSTYKIQLEGKAQAIGAEITYHRRYQYAAILGLSAEDNDGNDPIEEKKEFTSTYKKTPKEPKPAPSGESKKTIKIEDVNLLQTIEDAYKKGELDTITKIQTKINKVRTTYKNHPDKNKAIAKLDEIGSAMLQEAGNE